MSWRKHPTKNRKLKPGEPQWYQVIEGRGKKRVTHVRQFEDDLAAEVFDNMLKRSHRPLIHTIPTVIKSFDAMLPDFIHYYTHELERRPRSVDAWLQGWHNLKPFFGSLKPTQLTPQLIEKYKQHRLEQKAGKRNNLVCKRTVQKELHNLSSYIKYCVDAGICDPLPFKIKGYAKKNTTAAPVIPPTPEQVQMMFRQVRRTDVLDLYKSFYYTGLRSEELRLLQRKHVYLEWGIITVCGKGGKWRIVPIVPPYRLTMMRLCKGLEPEGYLFISKRTGKPYSANVGRLDTSAKKAGIATHITPHVLRKCFATHCIYWGCDMRTLQLILGHSEITTTERYTFLPPSMLQEKLSEFGILRSRQESQFERRSNKRVA